MAHSMTGFGSAEGELAGGRLQLDLRSVNHRHLNIQVKAPHLLAEFEGQIRDLIRAVIERGHVTVSARWTEEPVRDATLKVNADRAVAVRDALQELGRALGIDDAVGLDFIARQPDVLTTSTGEEAPVAWDDLASVLRAALDQFLTMRAREGDVLTREILERLNAMEDRLAVIRDRAPARLVAEKERLSRAVAELTEGRPVDEHRLAQEIALLADRLDVTEEIVRLDAHVAAARDALSEPGAVGKRLGFLGQEMLREVNTIGSKANDTAMAHEVVSMKGELEKIREQVENIE